MLSFRRRALAAATRNLKLHSDCIYYELKQQPFSFFLFPLSCLLLLAYCFLLPVASEKRQMAENKMNAWIVGSRHRDPQQACPSWPLAPSVYHSKFPRFPSPSFSFQLGVIVNSSFTGSSQTLAEPWLLLSLATDSFSLLGSSRRGH